MPFQIILIILHNYDYHDFIGRVIYGIIMYIYIMQKTFYETQPFFNFHLFFHTHC